MKSLILFAAIQVIAFFLGSSDIGTLSLIVFGLAAALIVSAYLSAFKKDKQNEKRIVKAVFEIQ